MLLSEMMMMVCRWAARESREPQWKGRNGPEKGGHKRVYLSSVKIQLPSFCRYGISISRRRIRTLS